jgi:hypothetical protein
MVSVARVVMKFLLIEMRGPFPPSQQPVTDPCPEPVESSPQYRILPSSPVSSLASSDYSSKRTCHLFQDSHTPRPSQLASFDHLNICWRLHITKLFIMKFYHLEKYKGHDLHIQNVLMFWYALSSNNRFMSAVNKHPHQSVTTEQIKVIFGKKLIAE